MRTSWLVLPMLLSSTFLIHGQHSKKAAIRTLDGRKISGSEADRIADAELAAEHVMGAQLAILNGGRVVWTHVYGLRDAQAKLPMTADTVATAASVTKSVFATWVMLQVERGLVDLDEPVAHMLPKPLLEYERYKESAVEMVADPRWLRLTPRMLLSHRAGLANFARFEPDKKMRLHFEPGTQFAYSGEGLELLQFALETKLGVELGAAMERDLFAPLRMSHTSMAWKEEFAANAEMRYSAKDELIGPARRKRADVAGSMVTSVNDLGAFLEALLAGRVLKPETLRLMLTPQVRIGTAQQFPMLQTQPGTEGPKVGLAYGLGWGLLTKTKYGPAFFKEGHEDGAENYVICFAKSGSCMVLLTNSNNGELAFRPLLEKLLGDTVTPWVWESYTREQILASDEHSGK